jgi:hypothetical protein
VQRDARQDVFDRDHALRAAEATKRGVRDVVRAAGATEDFDVR